ncbi:lytic polysaccharide monooxygenase [uncultured Aquimarina sp.]|uniref:lytic polysaccharide monooxygenase n=1 Tax=uncultured Aquimarina sp. TaxID=575652 RepID=UPI00260D95C1|nr:lytic polysaccharide monooxygenase [uncultured Aquimarina sp.]
MNNFNNSNRYLRKFENNLQKFLKPIPWQSMLLIATFFVPFQSVLTHGTVTYPPSRVYTCFQENPESPDSPACQDAVIGWGTQALYDWNEVARMDAGGMHMDIIMDGNLASAGRPDKYGGLDQVRDDWVATPVTPGPLTVTWTNTAPHETLYYRVYITKSDWNPNMPLTWDSLELLVETGPRPASETDNIDVVLPARTGKHVLYSIWQRSLTPEAFYSTSDIDFGATNEPTPPVAIFTSDNGRCGGSEVNFSAADSYDPNGDALTYTWDFGDGTTAQGVEVSHTYSGLTSADVTLTVSDGSFSSGSTQTIDLIEDPDCVGVICPFDTPNAEALPTLIGSYRDIFVLGENGPDLSNHKFDINWNLTNDGLYQFSIQSLGAVSVWTDLRDNLTQTFKQDAPEATLSGTGIQGFDGDYYVTTDGDNFVMVSKSGDFTIYFSTTDTAPSCASVLSVDEFDTGAVLLNNYPNPFAGTTNIQYILQEQSSVSLKVYTLSGQLVKSINETTKTPGKYEFQINLEGMSNGVYLYKLQTDKGVQTKRMILQQ